jgi:hypothetical protein
MGKIIPEGFIATKDEMSYPDCKARLAQARKESRDGKYLSLDAYVARRSQRSPTG